MCSNKDGRQWWIAFCLSRVESLFFRSLVFESRDLGHPSRVTSASQVVRARQQDRNCPLLAQKSYQLHIPEDLPISTTWVHNLHLLSLTCSLQTKLNIFIFCFFVYWNVGFTVYYKHLSNYHSLSFLIFYKCWLFL